ncbi:hypothetical protein C8Q75DRAFT_802105 [Abortiporus biennis]|nr:hypothetical protein C8Q75DRAFT_802105 [Abortiporus biennis]
MSPVNTIRIFLYVTLWIVSVILLGLAAYRIHYTTHLPRGDPLNGGRSFYDPIIAEVIFTTIVTILWVPFMVHILIERRDYGIATSFAGEVLSLCILFLFWIVGAGVSTNLWGDLSWCQEFLACRVLSTLVAFLWIGWVVILTLLVLSLLFAVTNKAWNQPSHGAHQKINTNRWSFRA